MQFAHHSDCVWYRERAEIIGFLSVERRLGPRTFGTGMQVMIQFLQIAAASSNGEDPVAFGLRFLAQAEE